MRRVSWAAGLLTIPLLLGLAASQVMRDGTPPGLVVEAPEAAPAGAEFSLFMSASEPVTFAIRYGDELRETIGQDVTLSLVAEAGERTLEIAAADAAGNRTVVERTVVGIREPTPWLRIPEVVGAGIPVTVELAWDPADAEVVAAGLTADGIEVPLVRQADRAIGFVAAPLTTDPAVIALSAWLQDGFGRRVSVAADLPVQADKTPIEELNVPASTLSVITPEGRVLERDAIGRATAAAALPALRWKEPFLLPVEGVVTSRFGGPRRYAPGGPVSFHTGTDFRAPTGTPIRATNAGIVQVADFYPIKGGLVVLDHGGGVTSLYFHLSKIGVAVGDEVPRGHVIGESGATGLVTGPHLHWEMQVLGRPSDPLAWVDRLVPGEGGGSAVQTP